MRVEAVSSNTYYERSESAGKSRKKYIDNTKDIYKPTCVIHSPRNSSYECKVLGYFGSKYSKSRPAKDRGHNTATRKKFNWQQENNAIVNHAVD